MEELQADVEHWVEYYNNERPHSGKYRFGRTHRQTFLDLIQLAKDGVVDGNFSVANITDCQTSS